MLSIVAFFDLELEQLDIKTALLHGDPDETICMKQTPSFETRTKKIMLACSKSLFMDLNNP